MFKKFVAAMSVEKNIANLEIVFAFQVFFIGA